MSQRETLEVQMDDRLVGTLALTANHKVAFSYSLPDAWEQKRCGKNGIRLLSVCGAVWNYDE